MALTNCTECKREISTSALACPGCGAPALAAVAPHAAPGQPLVLCGKCGHQVAHEGAPCATCGSVVAAAKTQGKWTRYAKYTAIGLAGFFIGLPILVGAIVSIVNPDAMKPDAAVAKSGSAASAVETAPDNTTPLPVSPPAAATTPNQSSDSMLQEPARLTFSAKDKSEAKSFIKKMTAGGYIKSIECRKDSDGGTVLVREAFYREDFEEKKLAAGLFYVFCAQQGELFAGIYLVDARTNERAGRYSPGGGLSMEDGL